MNAICVFQKWRTETVFVKTDLAVELKRFLVTENANHGGGHPSSLAGYYMGRLTEFVLLYWYKCG